MRDDLGFAGLISGERMGYLVSLYLDQCSCPGLCIFLIASIAEKKESLDSF
jgi:hypothetical protein